MALADSSDLLPVNALTGTRKASTWSLPLKPVPMSNFPPKA